jgi:hypothetical protein
MMLKCSLKHQFLSKDNYALLLVSRCPLFYISLSFYFLSFFKLALQVDDLVGMLREQLELEDDEVVPLMGRGE